MPDEPVVNMERCVELVRKKMVRDEDYEGGQKMIHALKALGRAPTVNGRPILGLEDEVFDGETACRDMIPRLDALREERDSRMTERKRGR